MSKELVIIVTKPGEGKEILEFLSSKGYRTDLVTPDLPVDAGYGLVEEHKTVCIVQPTIPNFLKVELVVAKVLLSQEKTQPNFPKDTNLIVNRNITSSDLRILLEILPERGIELGATLKSLLSQEMLLNTGIIETREDTENYRLVWDYFLGRLLAVTGRRVGEHTEISFKEMCNYITGCGNPIEKPVTYTLSENCVVEMTGKEVKVNGKESSHKLIKDLYKLSKQFQKPN